MSFASFLIDSRIGDKIDKIILFGSVAKGDSGKESDIDIFVDTRMRIEKDINKLLGLFVVPPTMLTAVMAVILDAVCCNPNRQRPVFLVCVP